MLNKGVVMDLLNNGEFTKIVDYFSDEYRLILENFLIKNNIGLDDDDSMIDVMYKVEMNFPKHSGLMMLISAALYNEDMTIGDRIEKLIDLYNTVKTRLT